MSNMVRAMIINDLQHKLDQKKQNPGLMSVGNERVTRRQRAVKELLFASILGNVVLTAVCVLLFTWNVNLRDSIIWHQVEEHAPLYDVVDYDSEVE